MAQVHPNARTVVWGYSQGGHAALSTALRAGSYAPEVDISGVAAIAPATDLPALLAIDQHKLLGRIMSSYILRAYSERYGDVDFDAYTSGMRRSLARDMARRCLTGGQAVFAALEALAAGGSVFRVAPGSGPLGRRLNENAPGQPLTQPLLIAQGLADDLVIPEVQAEFVARRCSAGQALEFRRYAGRDHLSIVAADSPVIPDLLKWTQDRFDGIPIPPGCRNVVH